MLRKYSSKLSPLFFSIFLIISALSINSLEAGGWGKAEEVKEFEGANWNGIFFDMNGLHFTASIPNYSGASLQNGEVTLKGVVKGEADYIVSTSFNSGFMPIKSKQEFIKIIKEANPDFTITEVDSKNLGARYAVDLIPKNQKDKEYWRLLLKDRLVKMKTTDTNENRRRNFFESIYIHK